MDFGDAIRALKEGQCVARRGWNGPSMFLYLVPGSRFSASLARPPLSELVPKDSMIDYRPHIDMKTAQGDHVPWLASQSDVLEEDWEIVRTAAVEHGEYWGDQASARVEREQGQENDPVDRLPNFKSHKVVRAARILGIENPPGVSDSPYLRLDSGNTEPSFFVPVDQEYLDRHKPQVGGYFVVYDDGYRSWSPAKAFEEGYTPLDAEGGG